MPTAYELASAYYKLERAEQHINDLTGRIDRFLEQRPFKLISHYRRKAGQIAYRVEANQRIPSCFSLILGDAIHNLRSALDLMLFAMANERAPSPDKIQFPFPKKESDEALTGAITNGQVKFAGNKVEETIRRLDPRPSRNPILNAIHFLDIRDKHRFLILSRGIANFSGPFLIELTGKPTMRVRLPGGEAANVSIYSGGSALMAAPDDHDILTYDMNFATRDLPDSKDEVKVQPAFVITFGKGQPLADQIVVTVLRNAAGEVRHALNEMLVAFLDPENVRA